MLIVGLLVLACYTEVMSSLFPVNILQERVLVTNEWEDVLWEA